MWADDGIDAENWYRGKWRREMTNFVEKEFKNIAMEFCESKNMVKSVVIVIILF